MDEKMINYGNRTGMKRRRRRYNVKRIVALLVILIAIIVGLIMFVVSLFSGGDENEKEVLEKQEEEFIEVLIKPWEVMTEEETISNLSGLPVSKSEAAKRPVAIMFHNRLDTLPQSGLSKAEIVYEIPTDGELVGLLGVFQDISQEKIGPVRSIRKQVIDYALDNDAILVHYKSGDVAKLGADIEKAIKEINSPSIDAGDYEDTMTTSEIIAAGTVQAEATTSTESKTTQADQTIKFVTGTGIKSTWAKKGYKLMREPEKQIKMFKFGISDEKAFDMIANVARIDYSYYQISEFRYDPKSMTYKRFQTVGYKDAQQMDSLGTVDTTDDEPLAYKNIIIQYVTTTTDETTNNIEINAVSEGEGLYLTNGTYTPIKWSKKDHYEPTKYLDLAGNEIEFNRGKTWISIVPNTIEVQISETLKDSGLTSKSVITKKVSKEELENGNLTNDLSADNEEDLGVIDTMPNASKIVMD